MQILIYIIYLTLISFTSCGQSLLQEEIKKNTHIISSIYTEDISDLNYLANAIGNSRVVMLGEQDHGDATTFEAKTRIIRYLHENLGFNVIVFESDFFALNGSWENVKSSEDIIKLTEGNIFSVWSNCQQFSGLKQYLIERYKSDKPLEIAGMDVQLHGLYSQEHFTGWFVDFIHSRGIGEISLEEFKGQFIPILDSVLYHSKKQTSLKDTILLKSFQKQLGLIKEELTKQGLSNEYEMQVLKSLQSQVYLMLSRNVGEIRKGAQERDKQMADNLSWLMANKFKGKKVIVWAASSHIYKTSFEPVAKISPDRFYPMGYYFTTQNATLPVYILGFTSYYGISKRVGHKPYSFESKEPNSFEEWVNSKGTNFAFIDLEKVRVSVGKRETFLMAGAGHIQTEQFWMEGFNGVFYIRKMEPCTLSE